MEWHSSRNCLLEVHYNFYLEYKFSTQKSTSCSLQSTNSIDMRVCKQDTRYLENDWLMISAIWNFKFVSKRRTKQMQTVFFKNYMFFVVFKLYRNHVSQSIPLLQVFLTFCHFLKNGSNYYYYYFLLLSDFNALSHNCCRKYWPIPEMFLELGYFLLLLIFIRNIICLKIGSIWEKLSIFFF